MPAVNPRVLDALRAMEAGAAPGLLRELIDLFLRETEPRLLKLRDVLAARDAAGLARLAQTLKASCGNLGAQAMSRMCADLTPAGRPVDWTRAAAVLASLETEFPSVRAELEAERGAL